MIEPEEIRKREFNRVIRGYDPVEVRFFLEMLADEMEELRRKLAEYELPDFEGKTPKEVMEFAGKEAEKIVEEARRKAEEVVVSAEKQRRVVEAEIERLKVKKHQFVRQVEELLEKLREFIEVEIPDLSDEG